LTIDLPLSVAALVAALAQGVALVVAWTKAAARSERNSEDIGELKRQHEALLKLVNVSREESLRRFVTTEMLQAVESRIVAAIERLGDRLDNVIDGHRRGS